MAIGMFDEAIKEIDKAIEHVETNGDFCYMPALLRLRVSLLMSMAHSKAVDKSDVAENCLMQSLEWSRRQGARAWELRTAIDHAAYLANQGRSAEGQALLQPVFEQFAEGFDTADVKAAEHLLA